MTNTNADDSRSSSPSRSHRPGALIAGLTVGHWTAPDIPTGVTVIVPTGRAAAAVDVRGCSPATRETDLLAEWRRVDRVDAIVLSGGSAYGLGAAHGAMIALAARGRGYPTSAGVVPIVPAAALFDLSLAGVDDNGVPRHPPVEAGGHAVDAASTTPEWGCVGADAGSTVGKSAGVAWVTKSGIGAAAADAGRGHICAVAAVNCVGDVVEDDGTVIAGCRKSRGSGTAPELQVGQNTTLVVVATDMALSPADLKAVAIAGQDGLARAIRPAHTRYDGDVVFALAVPKEDFGGNAPDPRSEGDVDAAVAVAADIVAASVRHAVRAATSAYGIPATGG